MIAGHNGALCRELANLRPNQCPTSGFIQFAEDIKNSGPVDLTVIKGEDLVKENLNLIYAVGKGAENEPCMISLHYKGNPSSDKTHGLIGKGVIFDAGGLNIK